MNLAVLAFCAALPVLLPEEPVLLPQEPVLLPEELVREDVRYPSGELELAAELIRPAGAKWAEAPLPAAVVLQGSGDSDRSNPWAAAIAEEIARAGLVALLTDKRGCGASQGSWRTAGFSELAADALAGLAYLTTRPEVDPARIGLVGLSQGGWVAPIAAARSDRVAFVVDVSGAGVGFAEQTLVEMTNTARSAGLSDEGVRGVLRLNRAAARYALTGDWEPYAAALERARGTEWEELAGGFPSEPDLPVWTFLRKVADFDPLPYWTLVDAPVLVLFGEEDEHDNVPVAESVRRLEHAFARARKDDVTLRVIPGAGHAFIDPEQHILLPEFLRELLGWMAANTRD